MSSAVSVRKFADAAELPSRSHISVPDAPGISEPLRRNSFTSSARQDSTRRFLTPWCRPDPHPPIHVTDHVTDFRNALENEI
jgi:hypothetical protein